MTPIILPFADGEYPFSLAKMALLQELQEKTDSGPMAVFRRVATGQWRVEDVLETIRLGLIGGGCAPEKAVVLVQRYVLERPLLESVKIAVAILQAVLAGADTKEGNGDGGTTA